MDVLFLSPAFPPEVGAFTRALARVGARVVGVGDVPASALPASVRRALVHYIQVPTLLDEADVTRRVLDELGDARPDRVETHWEPVTLLAAQLRERLGVEGLDVQATRTFRDKDRMKAVVAAAGLPVVVAARVRTAAEAHAQAEKLGFPVIVKPVAGAGSADTLRADDPASLDRILGAVAHHGEVVIEPFVDADEHTFEAVCIQGEPVFTSVSTYLPNTLDARSNEWISPVILCRRHLDSSELSGGLDLGLGALRALGMGTGFAHMEWFRHADGRVSFGEAACRAPGANMVDLMNYANDIDLYMEWARCVVHGSFQAQVRRPFAAAIVFKRAVGHGRIAAVEGLDRFLSRHGHWVRRVDLLPLGAERRDWTSTFLSDGNLVVRHPDEQRCLDMAREAARSITLYAS